MNWQEQGGISEVFYTYDRKFAFQRVDRYWRLYGNETLSFIQEFTSFVSMNEFIIEQRRKVEAYQVCFVDGHDMKYKTFKCEANSCKEAIEKMMDAYGANFDHQVKDVYKLEV